MPDHCQQDRGGGEGNEDVDGRAEVADRGGHDVARSLYFRDRRVWGLILSKHSKLRYEGARNQIGSLPNQIHRRRYLSIALNGLRIRHVHCTAHPCRQPSAKLYCLTSATTPTTVHHCISKAGLMCLPIGFRPARNAVLWRGVINKTGGRIHAVGAGEFPAGQQRNAHEMKVVRADSTGPHHGRWKIDGFGMSLDVNRNHREGGVERHGIGDGCYLDTVEAARGLQDAVVKRNAGWPLVAGRFASG